MPSPAILICLVNAKHRMSKAYFEHLICHRIDKRRTTGYADLPQMVSASRFILGNEVTRSRNRNRGTEKTTTTRPRHQMGACMSIPVPRPRFYPPNGSAHILWNGHHPTFTLALTNTLYTMSCTTKVVMSGSPWKI